MPDIDYLAFAPWLVGVGMLATLIGAGIIGWHARTSPNLVLGCATLIGAMVFSVVQGYMALQPSPAREFIDGLFQFDPAGPTIRHVRRAVVANQPLTGVLLNSLKTIPETSANGLLVSLKPWPNPKWNDAERHLKQIAIGTDFALFTLLHYIKIRQPDWQAKWALIETPFGGVSSLRLAASYTQRDCTDVGPQQLQSLLREGGNLFADAPLNEFATNALCLPPKSKMRLTNDSLTISNPFLDITFTVRPAGGSGFGDLIFQIDAVTVYHALRAQHPSMPDYHRWVDRLVEDARQWFGVV